MILMLTYRCSLDCDHCMIYKTGPDGEHMSQWVLESALSVFKKIRSNTLGIAGGEPLEHPQFWDILKMIRKSSMSRGFGVKVATSGEPFDRDLSLIEKAAKAYPVTFQITRTSHFYKKLKTRSDLEKLSNVYFHSIFRFYKSKKSIERGAKYNVLRRNRLYCEEAWWLRRSMKQSLNFASFVRQWEGYDNFCSIHVHPDGSIRMGPLDICHSLGNIIEMDKDFVAEGRRAMVRMGKEPCRRCGMTGKIR